MMLAEERRRKIVQELRIKGAVRTSELSSMLSVSEITIRNDLDVLAERNLLQRAHGGAVLPEALVVEPTHTEREGVNLGQKMEIGRAAAEMVEEGSTICLGTGTTVLQMVPHLAGKRDITVLTNSLTTGLELTKVRGIRLSIIGGSLRRRSYAMVGPSAERYFEDIYVDRLFLGVNGISVEHGITIPSVAEAQVCRLMMGAAQETFVLADSSKFSVVAHAKIADVQEIDAVVTDNMVAREYISQLDDLEVEVVVAPAVLEEGPQA